MSLNLLVINGEYLHTETSYSDLWVHKCRTLVFCQSSHKIPIIISAECAQGETGGILFLFNMCIARKQERKPKGFQLLGSLIAMCSQAAQPYLLLES